MLKNLILVPEDEIDVPYIVIIKFIPEVKPEPENIEALIDGQKDRAENGTVFHYDVNWY